MKQAPKKLMNNHAAFSDVFFADKTILRKEDEGKEKKSSTCFLAFLVSLELTMMSFSQVILLRERLNVGK